MCFISISICSALQTVTDGLALSSEETSRTNSEALTAVSAQMCCALLCVSFMSICTVGQRAGIVVCLLLCVSES